MYFVELILKAFGDDNTQVIPTSTCSKNADNDNTGMQYSGYCLRIWCSQGDVTSNSRINTIYFMICTETIWL